MSTSAGSEGKGVPDAPSLHADDELRPLLTRLGAEVGLDALGSAPVAYPRHEQQLKAWLDEGRHAGMSWLAESADLRLDVRRRFPGARSLLVGVKAYRPHDPLAGSESGIVRGVSAYARGRDYHEVLLDRFKLLGNRLEQELTPRPVRRHAYVDTGPVLERQAAVEAGLGWQGKNGLLLRPGEGSWTFLGVLVTDLDLSPGPLDGHTASGSCGSCRACLAACPTGALIAPGVIDSGRCISYLTIEHRGPIDRSLRRAMGGWIFGCDLCQTACPINHRALRRQKIPGGPAEDDFTAPSPALTGITLPQLLSLDEDAFRQRFRKTPLWRPRREGLLRNALIAAANLRRLDCVDPARALLRDPSWVLREAASWCLSELRPPEGLDDLRAAMQREEDAQRQKVLAQDLIRWAGALPRSG